MTPSRTDALADRLRTQIAEGAVPPGHKLPSEAQLIAEHEVSRTVVREALGRLQAEGLIHTRRGAGSYALAPPAATTTPAVRPVRTVEDRLRLIEFRVAVETEAAALAAARRSTAQLTSLENKLEAFSSAEGNPAQAMQHDFRFHRLLAEAAGNPYLLDAVEGLGSTMITMPRTRIAGSSGTQTGNRAENGSSAANRSGAPPSSAGSSSHQQAAQEHGQILAAVATQDPQAAAAAMRTHLTASRSRLLRDSGT